MVSASSKSNQPDRKTMEGMIWNANYVLKQALMPGAKGIPKSLFRKCKGVALLSTIEAGFVVTGCVGTGIVLAKKENGSWSKNPCACRLTGAGCGAVLGGSLKHIIVFIMEDTSLKSFASDAGIRVGAQIELTLGSLGHTAHTEMQVGNKGIGGTVAMACSQGAFLGVSLEGAFVESNDTANKHFYDEKVSPKKILFDDNLRFPPYKMTMMKHVHNKLAELSLPEHALYNSSPTKKPQTNGETKPAARQSLLGRVILVLLIVVAIILVSLYYLSSSKPQQWLLSKLAAIQRHDDGVGTSSGETDAATTANMEL